MSSIAKIRIFIFYIIFPLVKLFHSVTFLVHFVILLNTWNRLILFILARLRRKFISHHIAIIKFELSHSLLLWRPPISIWLVWWLPRHLQRVEYLTWLDNALTACRCHCGYLLDAEMIVALLASAIEVMVLLKTGQLKSHRLVLDSHPIIGFFVFILITEQIVPLDCGLSGTSYRNKFLWLLHSTILVFINSWLPLASFLG